MLQIMHQMRFMLIVGPVDFRKLIDGQVTLYT